MLIEHFLQMNCFLPRKKNYLVHNNTRLFQQMSITKSNLINYYKLRHSCKALLIMLQIALYAGIDGLVSHIPRTIF